MRHHRGVDGAQRAGGRGGAGAVDAPRDHPHRPGGGGVFVGAGIGAMHYIGMRRRRAPVMRYDPWMFAASVLVAVLPSWPVVVWAGARGALAQAAPGCPLAS